MESFVIARLPLALVLYGGALFLCLFDRRYKSTGWVFPLLSAALCLAATAYSLVMGSSVWECAVVLLVFLLLNVGVKEKE